LQSDAEHKQDQAELFHELQRVMVDGLVEVSHQNRGKQHACGAELDAPHLQAAQRHPGHADQRDHRHGVGCGVRARQVEKPVHV
jgi:hypothetical protein